MCTEKLARMLLDGGMPKAGSALLGILNSAIMETQPNGAEIVYFSGKYVGSSIMKAGHKKGIKSVPLLIKTALEKLDIGSMAGVNLRGNKIFLEMESCPFHKIGSKGNCKFIQGMLAGIISRASNKTYRMKAVTCKGANRPHCIFEFDPVGR
jgi:predicted hydrocarbon binding protein